MLVYTPSIVEVSFRGITVPYAFYETASCWKQNVLLTIHGCTLTAWRRPLAVRAWGVEFNANCWYHMDEPCWTNDRLWTGFGLELAFLMCCTGLTDAVLTWTPEVAWFVDSYEVFSLSESGGTLTSVPRTLRTPMFQALAKRGLPHTLTYLGLELNDRTVLEINEEDLRTLGELIGPLLGKAPSVTRFHARGSFAALDFPILEDEQSCPMEQILGPVALVRSLIPGQCISELVLTDWGAKICDVVELFPLCRGLTKVEAYL
ncbi:hypothetical protein GYMLUDRAFT_69769 [Collybiopsis luxurians FD-317 M1]|nr:hypothetical protein GYMLUDRAFT_69769 [Collybiopsis luxurians FD-317 M1]